MSAKRKIEIFSAGCLVCQETIAAIKDNVGVRPGLTPTYSTLS